VLHGVRRSYTLNFKEAHGISTSFSLWQDRFWDHAIRDEDGLANHFDYIHWHPVRRTYVPRPVDWAQPTPPHWRDRGYCKLNWEHSGEPSDIEGMELE
jgi:putative transposase